jgi:hypothetical protein
MNAPGRRSAVWCCLVVAVVAGAATAGVGAALPADGEDTLTRQAATQSTDSPAAETLFARSATASQDDAWSALVQEDIDADTVELVVDVTESGDAEWQVIYRLRLDTDADEQAFTDLQSDIETNTSAYLGPFEERIRDTVGTAENATGREMSAGNFAVTTEREEQPQSEFGLVTFRYEWAGFAVSESERIEAGDAVDQLFLDEDEQIEFRWPDGYRLESSTPAPDVSGENRAVYRGRFDFDAGQPRLVFAPGDESGGGLPWLLVAVVAVGALAAGGGLFWWRRRAGEPTTADTPPTSADEEVAGGSTGGGPTDTDAGAEPAGTDDEQAGPPPELLSNEERLLQLLEQNGGRMKQKAVADQLEWSAAKTSQVVGDLREAEKVESFRLGRENVLTLPEVDIDETLSADDEGSSNE